MKLKSIKERKELIKKIKEIKEMAKEKNIKIIRKKYINVTIKGETIKFNDWDSAGEYIKRGGDIYGYDTNK